MVGEEEEALIIKDLDHFTVAGLYKRISYIYLKREPKKRAGDDEERVRRSAPLKTIPHSYPENLSVGGLADASANLGGDPPPMAEKEQKNCLLASSPASSAGVPCMNASDIASGARDQSFLSPSAECHVALSPTIPVTPLYLLKPGQI